MRIKRKNFTKISGSAYQIQVNGLFKTLRDAKRYMNGLYSTLPLVKSEVNLCDFFILETIRAFYPEAYDNIWQNPWFFIYAYRSEKFKYRSPYYVYDYLGYEKDKNPKYEDARKDIDALMEKATKEGKNGRILGELLKDLFPIANDALSGSKTGWPYPDEAMADKRIMDPECFEKYFILKVPKTVISDSFVEKIIMAWNSMENPERNNVIEGVLFNNLQPKAYLLEFIDRL